ncbi:MAG: hypothetical protein M3A24_01175, partial [Candidatus Rhabdochlamydia oedothoracis]|nr:hypothetical protein [Candidatus Rhabdochlamydia oedothoracis]
NIEPAVAVSSALANPAFIAARLDKFLAEPRISHTFSKIANHLYLCICKCSLWIHRRTIE